MTRDEFEAKRAAIPEDVKAALRAEFGHVDLRFAEREGGQRGLRRARAYHDAYLRIDPDNPRTIALARRRLRALREVFPEQS
jgi:hypothetical protein